MSDYSGTDNLEVMAEAINYNRFLTELVLTRAKVQDRILDFGAGIGTFASIVANAGHDVCCVEPDPKQAELIAQRGLEVHVSLDRIADASLDYIYTLNVLEHIEDDIGVLRQLRSKLKPLGRLLVYVPAFQTLYSSMDRKVGHHRRYRADILMARAREAGFEVREWRYIDCLGFFASLVYKMIGNELGEVNRRALVIYDRFVFPVSRFCDRICGRWFGKNVLLVAESKSGNK